MSYNYAGYQPGQPDYTEWQQPYQPYNRPQTQTFITPFGQPNPPGMNSLVHLQNPHARHHQGQSEYQPQRTLFHSPDSYGQHRTHQAEYQPWQPTYHPPGQPPLNRSLSHRRSAAPLPTTAPPPPPRSGSTHLPQPSRNFIDSGQQHGLPNIMVRSLSHAQLAAVSDYNEKLRIYRLEQAALLARVTAWFGENIDNENLSEENTDNTSTMVLCENVPDNITDVPDNATHNDGATINVPNNEFLEEIVKNDKKSPQVFIETMDRKNMVYDDKNGVLIDPTHRELERKDDVEALIDDYVACHEDITKIVIKSLSNMKIGATNVNSKRSRSHIMFTCIIEFWCCSSIQGLIQDLHRPFAFDPGGIPRQTSIIEPLSCFVVSTLRARWISTAGELIRVSHHISII
ncbi:F-box protein At-B-like [Salvia divinorum]|uniref:F-box protein At-B-like n=1 Tax=Salvia divinorum TaxID=28513 RepID=A0ABD1HNR5_SALDI